MLESTRIRSWMTDEYFFNYMRKRLNADSHDKQLIQALRHADHFFFDVDGTIVFTKPTYFRQKVRETLKALKDKYPEKIPSIHLSTIHTAADIESLAKQIFPDDPGEFFTEFNKHDKVNDRLAATDVFPDAAFFLATLDKLGKKSYLVSHLQEKFLKRITLLIYKKVRKYVPYNPSIVFKQIVSPYHTRFAAGSSFKPHPGMFTYLLQEHDLDPKACAAIGDSMHDVHAALAASIGVPAYLTRGKKHAEGDNYLSVKNLVELFSLMRTA